MINITDCPQIACAVIVITSKASKDLSELAVTKLKIIKYLITISDNASLTVPALLPDFVQISIPSQPMITLLTAL